VTGDYNPHRVRETTLLLEFGAPTMAADSLEILPETELFLKNL
jgi:hypothetical protein